MPELEALEDGDQRRFDRFCEVLAWALSCTPYAVQAGIGAAFSDDADVTKRALEVWKVDELLKSMPNYRGPA